MAARRALYRRERHDCAIGSPSASLPVQRSAARDQWEDNGETSLGQSNGERRRGGERANEVLHGLDLFQDAVDQAGLDATLLREFCTLGGLILVPWQSGMESVEMVNCRFFGTLFSPEDVAGTHMVKLENELAKLIAKREKLLAMKRPSEIRNRRDDWGVERSVPRAE
eukprot:Skav236772  [mRNA]  locus=scaffold2707:151545:155621:+ [translate_table: standard]